MDTLVIKHDGVTRESSLSVKNSGINYIESVQLKVTFELGEEKNLFQWKLYLTSPDGKKRIIYFYETGTLNPIHFEEKQNTIFVAANAFLGNSQIDGTKLEIFLPKKDGNAVLKSIKSWNLVIRGTLIFSIL